MKDRQRNKKAGRERVLVTGSAGFIGSHLCQALVENGFETFGLYHQNKKKVKYLEKRKNFRLIKGEINDFKNILQIFEKVRPQGVFHAAALHSPVLIDNPFPFFRANVQGTLNLLEACRLQKIKRFIYSSSMSVYGKNIKSLPVTEKHLVNPHDFYSLTKYLGEELCKFYSKKYNLNIIMLRYVGVYGPRREWGAVANFVNNAVNNKILRILNNINWDIIYVKDVAKANINAFKKAEELKFQIINIGSGKQINIKELGRRIIKISKSRSELRFSKKLPSTPTSCFYYDIAKAKKLLNFKPTLLERGLKEYIEEI